MSTIVYRCDQDKQLTLADTERKLNRHLGHRLSPCWPRWWERWLLYIGWRP